MFLLDIHVKLKDNMGSVSTFSWLHDTHFWPSCQSFFYTQNFKIMMVAQAHWNFFSVFVCVWQIVAA